MSASLKPKVALSVAATNKAKDEKATTPTSASGRAAAGAAGAVKAPGMARGASVGGGGGGDVEPKSGAAEQVKDIWTQVIEHLNDEKRKAEEPAKAAAGGGDGKAADGKDAKGDAKGSDAKAPAVAGPSGREAVFLVVGSAGGGKTSLLMQYIPNKEELGTKGPPAPTTALEYRYARATVGLSTEKELSHFWELGGGRQMTRLLDIAITPDNIRDALAIVVVDISKPSKVVDDVQYWLDTVRARAEQCWTQLRAVGSDVPDRMAANAKAQFDPTEYDKLNVLALPTLIVASKYDVFASKDPEMQKMMARTLRALAHNSGCGLVYCSVREDFQATVKWFISRLNRHASNKGPSTTIQLDHRQPLSVPPGTDKMANIGQPPKAASSFLSGWIASYNSMFPKNPAEWTDDTGASNADLKLSEEPLLEPILAAKNDDLKKLQQDSALRRKIKAADSEASKRAAAANN